MAARGPTKAITPEIGEELMSLYAQGYTDDELIKWLKNHHGIPMSRRGMNAYRQRQFEARSIASMRAVGPKVELVMGNEVDELLKFKSFCLDNALEIWRNLPDAQKNTARNAFKFLAAYQKAQAQVFIMHGISEAAKAGQTMDDISHKLDEKFDKLRAALESTDEDTQPEGDE